MPEPYKDRNWLTGRYWKDGATLEEIGNEVDRTGACILWWMKRHNIKRRRAAKRPCVRREFEIRFREKIDVGREDECWLWTAYTCPFGYGVINHWEIKKRRRAHRITWEMENGSIPSGMCVLHHCDTPACCNPKHLFLGTRADNNRDKESKGRGSPHPGEKNGRAKLTDRQAMEIYSRVAQGEKLIDLANEYNVGQSTISRIKRRKGWKHIHSDEPYHQLRKSLPRDLRDALVEG